MRSHSTKDRAFRIIREEILSNRLRPGQSLNERSLSQRLKVSKTPIREAIQLLHKEGLIELVPQKGAFVAQITLNDIREIMQIRLGLEPLAASFAASSHNAEELAALEKEFVSFAENTPKDYKTTHEAGRRLHMYIIRCTRNQRMIGLLESLNDQMDRIRSLFYFDLSQDYVDQIFEEHTLIIKAIKEGDSVQAEEIMKTHIRNYWERLNEVVIKRVD
jgi:DNA-binding GntR family transcriptional regulator